MSRSAIAIRFTVSLAMLIAGSATPAQSEPLVLMTAALKRYVDRFNRHDVESMINHIPNQAAFDFLKDNIPLLDCPDEDIERTYYFRWWTYRKHLKETPDGFVVLEFLPPVSWAGKHNTISCPAGHHFYEGRWLRERRYLDDYSVFWIRKGGEPRRYSFWAADSIYSRFLVTGDRRLTTELLPDLVANFEAWENGWAVDPKQKDAGAARLGPNGLFWQIDDRDGMEISIGGSGYRATINSYMYGDAVAIARIAEIAARSDIATRFRRRAAEIKTAVEEKLWDEQAQFFKVLPQDPGAKLADVRELHGYTPWYFSLPSSRYSVAWKQLIDRDGFYAPYGPTTAERRHPRFMFEHKHECLWNGPSWPFATSATLTAMANLLNNYSQEFVSRRDYLELLRIFARSHRMKLPDGTIVPWIDENLHPDTGEWIARTILHARDRRDKDRGKDYNHSSFCDLVISGLIGLRPRADNVVEVRPLVPDGAWDYFALDNVRYRDRTLTILYDRTGRRYGRGRGLRVYADGQQIAASEKLQRVTGSLK
ncbi:MAG: hypothetical protein FJ280_00685 [Planctomycetes bacterium]|nr:hypothetical protein [Planctomycetota bacterium]